MNGDRPLISLNPSADGVSYAVLHALEITTIAGPRNAASTRDEVLNSRVLPPRQNFPYGQRIETVEKTVSCRFRRSLAGCCWLRFLGKQLRVGWRGGRMDWARILAFVTGTVDQELLARIEYLACPFRKFHPT
jgi:hypothetical protein